MYTQLDKACDTYFGNVCTGFGGKTICEFCGWDMYEHEPYKTEYEEFYRRFDGGE